MGKLLLVAIVLLIMAYNLAVYQERKKRQKIVEARKAKAEFEKNIDKLADAIFKRKYE